MIERKKWIAAPLGALALALTTPALAQDEPVAERDAAAADRKAMSAMMAGMGEVMGGMFPEPEPLTAEQTARLPIAMKLVEQMIPPGTYQQLMDKMMAPMMDGIMGGMGQMPMATLLAYSNLDSEEVENLGDTTLSEIMAIVDPAFEERNAIISEATVGMIGRMMTKVEPLYKDGLGRAYASRFDKAELAEIGGFFATSVGSKYAGESILIYADPQVMGAMQQAMPLMFEELPLMMEEMADKTANLPAVRSESDLTAEDRTRLAELLGIQSSELDTSALGGAEDFAVEAGDYLEEEAVDYVEEAEGY